MSEASPELAENRAASGFYLLRARRDAWLGGRHSQCKEKIRACSICNITDSIRAFLRGPTRSKKTICVVEKRNIVAIEKTRHTPDVHVLGDRFRLSGRGPDQLHIKSLIERLKGGRRGNYHRTNPTAEAKPRRLSSKLLKPLGGALRELVSESRRCDLEYADEVTMLKPWKGDGTVGSSLPRS